MQGVQRWTILSRKLECCSNQSILGTAGKTENCQSNTTLNNKMFRCNIFRKLNLANVFCHKPMLMLGCEIYMWTSSCTCALPFLMSKPAAGWVAMEPEKMWHSHTNLKHFIFMPCNHIISINFHQSIYQFFFPKELFFREKSITYGLINMLILWLIV